MSLTPEAFISPEYHPDTPYELRITDIDQNIDNQKITDYLNQLSPYWLAGEEFANNHHYHIALWLKEKPTKDWNTQLYDFFKPSKIGNAFYKIKPVKEIDQYLPYLTKDGVYFYPSNLEELANDAYEMSYPKPEGFKKEMASLRKKFVDGDIQTTLEVWDKYAQIKLFYDHDLNVNKARDFITGCEAKKDPSTWTKLFYLQ